MHVCMYVYTRTHTYTYTNTYMHAHIHTYQGHLLLLPPPCCQKPPTELPLRISKRTLLLWPWHATYWINSQANVLVQGRHLIDRERCREFDVLCVLCAHFFAQILILSSCGDAAHTFRMWFCVYCVCMCMYNFIHKKHCLMGL